MKQVIMLALVLTSIITSAFANNTDAINQKVLNSFSKNFAKAEDVKWEIRKDLYKATFKIYGQVMFAYYSEAGQQVAVSRNISISQLPIDLASELQSLYNKEYWLTDLFEVSANGETAYYATVENSTHVSILKADGVSAWMVFKKDKKQ